MSAVATITLPDAQGTPVNHSFVPAGQDKLGAWWYEDSSASAVIGNNRISLLLTRPAPPSPKEASANRMMRVKMAIHLPTLTTLGTNDAGLLPPPTLQYIERVNVEFVVPEETTLQNRKDIRKYLIGLLADPQVIAMIESMQNVY